jgi:hypothetical protein
VLCLGIDTKQLPRFPLSYATLKNSIVPGTWNKSRIASVPRLLTHPILWEYTIYIVASSCACCFGSIKGPANDEEQYLFEIFCCSVP